MKGLSKLLIYNDRVISDSRLLLLQFLDSTEVWENWTTETKS